LVGAPRNGVVDPRATREEVSVRLLGRQSYLGGVTTSTAKAKRESSMAGKAGWDEAA